jgi:predicted PurR-regulated permease PerM
MVNEKSLTYYDLERLVIFVVLLGLAYRFIQLTAEVLILFTLVFLVVLLLNPAVVWIEKRGLKRTFAAILGVLAVLIFLALLLTLALPPIIKQVNLLANQIPEITDNLLEKVKIFSEQFPFLSKITSALDIDKILTAPPVFTGIAKVSQNLVGVIFFAILSLFLIIFVLSNPKPLLTGFLQFFPEDKIEGVREGLILLSKNLATWFYSSLLIGIINGTIVGVGFFLIGIEFSLIFAVLYTLAEFIPLVGPLAIAIVAVLFALSQNFISALLVIAILVIIQILESTVWSPLILAHNLDLHPISIVFGILAAEVLIGIAGAILAVPILLIIKVFYYEFYRKTFPPNFLETEAEEIMEMELKHRETNR